MRTKLDNRSAFSNKHFILTNDRIIRNALKKKLEGSLKKDPDAKIIEELGITHGAARVDIAVVNGTIHGYELKSDMDTLDRLPEQMEIYNSVLDQVTLVAGKSHIYEAIKIIPDWWGITMARVVNSNGTISFYKIREAEKNPNQESIAVASLLWKKEALNILEERGKARGMRSKTRNVIYRRLAEALDHQTLREKVVQRLCARVNWRADIPYILSDD